MGVDVATYGERRCDGKWELILESDTGSFRCCENSRMLARFLGSIERELHNGLPCDLSPKLRLILGDERFCSWIAGEELKDWNQRRMGKRKYSEWISGFVTRDIPRLLDHGSAEDVRFIFEFSP